MKVATDELPLTGDLAAIQAVFRAKKPDSGLVTNTAVAKMQVTKHLIR